MTDFESYFDPSEILTLDRTFRFNDRLCVFSTQFILKNPNQIPKHLVSEKKSDTPSVTLIWSDEVEGAISETLSRINFIEVTPSEVLILGRYNHQQPRTLSSLDKRFPKLSLEYRTAHSAKGTEADYVIVISLRSANPRARRRLTERTLMPLWNLLPTILLTFQ